MLKDYFEVPNKPAIKSGNVLSCDFTDHETFIPQPLDFTRNTLATYVDCNGLIKVSGVSDIETVVNGNFTTDTDWSKTGTWEILNGKATASANSTSQYIQQDFNIVNGEVYKFTYEIIENTLNGNGAALSSFGGFGTVSISTEIGYHTQYITVTNQSAAYALKIGVSSTATSGVISIDNISLKKVDLNTPRIDYLTEIGKAKELQKPSLLLEPQSTNLFPKSNDVDPAAATKISNQIISPEGLQNAALYVENTATASHGAIKSAIFPTAGATTYTLSVFAKAKERSLLRLNLYADGASNLTDNFDLINGTVSDANSTIEDFGNGWFRCSTTKTITNSGGYNFAAVYMGKTINNYYYEGDGTSGLYLFGFQVEQQSYPTSYIPTSGSTLTRNVELCDNAGQRGVFNNEEGTLYVEFTELGFTNPNQTSIVISQENSSNNRVLLFRGGGSNWAIQIRAAGVNAVSNSVGLTTTETLNKFAKVAIRYKSGEIIGFVNGSQSFTNSSTFTFNGNLFKFGFIPYDSAVNNNFYGRVKNVKVFRRTLTDSEMAELTNNIT